MTDFYDIKLNLFCHLNPQTAILKNHVVKKIGMECLTPFCREINGFSEELFSAGSKFKNGDTLLARITPCLENGKTAFVNILGGDEVAFGSTEFIILREKQGVSDALFLYYFAISSDFRKRAISLMSGTSGRQRVDAKILGEEVFSLPPLDVQKRIAGILGTLDDRIDVLRRENVVLEQMAQAVFQSWFVDFDIVRAKAAGTPEFEVCEKYHITPELYALFPSALTPDDLPLDWEKKKLGDEFKIVMGQSPAGDTYNENRKGMPFFQGRRDFGFRYPTNRVYCTAPTRFAEKGDVLVSVRAPVGDLNIATEKCCIGRGVASVRHYTGDTAYTFYHLKNLSNDFAVFNGNGTVFGCIGKDDFLNLSFISCPQKTLEKLLPFFDAFENKIYENSKQIRTLEQTRDALLPQLLSGKIKNLR